MLEEINKETFDQYILSEPDGNLYQSSSYQEYKGNNPIYLAYKKGEFHRGFAAINIVKESLFKKTATCEFGYLTNIYDFDSLDGFQKELVSYLKGKKVNQFVISPNIPYLNKYGNNDRVIEKLKSYGYKVEENSIYTLDIEEKENVVSKDASVQLLLDSDVSSFKVDFSKEKNYFKDHFHTIVSKLDYDQTILVLNGNEEKIETIVRLKEQLKDDLTCQCISFVQYNNVLYVLDYSSRTNIIDTNPLLIQALCDYGKKNHCKKIVSTKKIDSLKNTKLIGKFTITI